MALVGGGRILHRALREVLLSPVVAASFQVSNPNFEGSDLAVIFLSTLFPRNSLAWFQFFLLVFLNCLVDAKETKCFLSFLD